jgi:NTE family protein
MFQRGYRMQSAIAWLKASLIVFSLLCAGFALAQNPDPADEPGDRPRIGLALSGGGARGYAHIGILKVFEENNIPIDYIAGASIGSMVGGLHASGLSASEIEEILLSMDWVSLYDDEPERRDRAYRRKAEDQRYILDFELGQKGFKLILPKGLSSWRKMNFFLRSHLQHVAHIRQFQDLPTPFKAMVTDIETGESIALDRGDLALAIRASMSLPAMFVPPKIEGATYVDGGIVNNLPVDTVREMGADVVIAVDIGSKMLSAEELNKLTDVSGQSMGILNRQVVEDQLSRADLILAPDLDGFGTLAFAKREAILDRGRVEAEEKLASLKQFALSDGEYERHLLRRQARLSPPEQANHLKSIAIAGLERVDERIVTARIRLKEGDVLDYEVLHDDLDRIFGLGDFEWVDFEVDAREDGTDLIILVKEKFWGPNYLHAGLELEIDSNQNTAINPLINYTRTRLNRLGGEWLTDIGFGEQEILLTELYQPLRFDGRLFCSPRFTAERLYRKFVVEGQEQIEFESSQYLGQFDLGINLGTYGEIRAGLVRGLADISIRSADEPVDQRIDLGGYLFSVQIDRLNSITFPRKGILAAVSAYLSRDEIGADDEYEFAGMHFVWAVSRRNHTFLYWMEGGTTFDDDAPPYTHFGIGGFHSLSGYDPGELSGPHYAIVRPTYFYKIGSLPSMVGKGIYVGGWLEAGNVWATKDDISLDDLRYAATATLGMETLLGPIYVAYGIAEDDRERLYLVIGRKF